MTNRVSPRNRTQKQLILCAVCLAALSMPLSFTGPALALPAISAQLGGSPLALNWITNAFMLSFGSSLMAAGTLADLLGRKRIFTGGMVLFILASLALSIVQNIVVFDCLRALQGLGAAAAFASGLAALAQEFEGRQRMHAFSLIGTTFGVGLSFGPLLCGILIHALGWRAIFLATTVTGIVALLFALRYMHESRDLQAQRLDIAGVATFTAALTSFTCGLLQAPVRGWHDPLVLTLEIAAAVLLLAFIVVEKTQQRPMLDLSLFRYPRFVGVQFLAAAPAYCFVVLLILLPVRFIGIEAQDEVGAGWMMMALSVPMLLVPMAAARLTRWFSTGVICGVGLAIATLGLLWLSTVALGQPASVMMWPLATIGFGTGFPWGLMDGLAVSVVPKERAGMAAGIFSTTRVAGEGVALAIVAALLAGFIHARLPAGAHEALSEAAQRLVMGNVRAAQQLLPSASRADLLKAYGEAFQLLLWILATITFATALLCFCLLGDRPQREDNENAEKLPA
ncbi:MAG: MFS transporter [Burkholderiales bacterium]|nr:MFS transporter [Burkholderiales bacterium]